MADIKKKIELRFSEEEAGELVPIFEQMARDMSRQPRVIQLLKAHGKASVDDLTPRQQAKLVLHMKIKAWKQQHKRREAEINHGDAASLAIENKYEVEVD
jgi:hypothetical protein